MKSRSLMNFSLVIIFTAASFLSIPASVFTCKAPGTNPYFLGLPPQPEDNQPSTAKIELGKILFFDPLLSGSNWISCATCHNPALGWSDGLPRAIGHNMRELQRHTPSIINAAYYTTLFWDGRAESLEKQALGPIQSPGEMNQNMDELIVELKKIQAYREMFAEAFPREGITKQNIARAIAAFERTIISRNSPFDRWQSGKRRAVSAEVKKGFELFKGKARCILCHSGPNFSDDGYHNIGVRQQGETKDAGRHAVTPLKISQGAFKTPTLRDIARTAPYMHNGAYRTLEEVVEHYNVGGVDKSNLDPNMRPLGLTEREKKQLTAFMKSLTGESPSVTIPVLPR